MSVADPLPPVQDAWNKLLLSWVRAKAVHSVMRASHDSRTSTLLRAMTQSQDTASSRFQAASDEVRNLVDVNDQWVAKSLAHYLSATSSRTENADVKERLAEVVMRLSTIDMGLIAAVHQTFTDVGQIQVRKQKDRYNKQISLRFSLDQYASKLKLVLDTVDVEVRAVMKSLDKAMPRQIAINERELTRPGERPSSPTPTRERPLDISSPELATDFALLQ